MLKLTYEEKINLMSTLNWDYLDKYEDMLAVIEGRLVSSGAFTQDKLFVRSMERLSWFYFTGLWGIETIKKLYSPQIANRIWPKDLRNRYDYAIKLLRGEPLPPARWGDEYYKQMWRPFLSDRWYSFKPGLL